MSYNQSICLIEIEAGLHIYHLMLPEWNYINRNRSEEIKGDICQSYNISDYDIGMIFVFRKKNMRDNILCS